TTETVKHYVKAGLQVEIEAGAGERAWFSDAAYQAAGATIGTAAGWSKADLVLKVQPASLDEAARLRAGARLVCFVIPSAQSALVARLASGNVTCFAMD